MTIGKNDDAMLPGRSDSDDAPGDPLQARIVAFVDGVMSRAEQHDFEAEIVRSRSLRIAVDRARCLRKLVSELPRVCAPEAIGVFAARFASVPRLRDAATVSELPLEDRLRLLRRRPAPVDLERRVIAQLRGERAVLDLHAARRAYRATPRQWAPTLLAAGFLVGVTTWLFGSREVRPEPTPIGRQLVFSLHDVRGAGVTDPFAALPKRLPPPFGSPPTEAVR